MSYLLNTIFVTLKEWKQNYFISCIFRQMTKTAASLLGRGGSHSLEKICWSTETAGGAATKLKTSLPRHLYLGWQYYSSLSLRHSFTWPLLVCAYLKRARVGRHSEKCNLPFSTLCWSFLCHTQNCSLIQDNEKIFFLNFLMLELISIVANYWAPLCAPPEHTEAQPPQQGI